MASPFPLPPIDATALAEAAASADIDAINAASAPMTEFEEIIKDAKRVLKRGMVMAILKDQLAKGVCPDIHLQQLANMLPKKQENSDYKMVTLSAKEAIDPQAFWKRTTEFVEKSDWIKKCLYCIEQRSEEENEPYGWHIHMLGNFALPKSKIVEKCYKSYSRFLAAPNYVDVTNSSESRSDYLKGIKCPAKMAKVLKDKGLREKYGIPHYLEKIPPSSK